jgi:NADH:ubiquinone oxidoreductase subunit K
MLNRIKTSELLILASTIAIIFISEYYYLVEGAVDKAIFIGLWPPTILSLLNWVNSKIAK